MQYIKLSQNKFAIVDDEDYEYLSQFKWCSALNKNSGKYYAVRAVKSKIEYMHRYVGARIGMTKIIGFKDKNPLNCCRSNLQEGSKGDHIHYQGIRKNNTTGYKGIIVKRNKYIARIANKHIGTFDTIEKAALAYDEAAKLIHGNFAVLNFPSQGYAHIKRD